MDSAVSVVARARRDAWQRSNVSSMRSYRCGARPGVNELRTRLGRLVRSARDCIGAMPAALDFCSECYALGRRNGISECLYGYDLLYSILQRFFASFHAGGGVMKATFNLMVAYFVGWAQSQLTRKCKPHDELCNKATKQLPL